MQRVVVLDFGSQYNQLIARRVRELKVYCEIHPFNLNARKIAALKPKAIILTGGPSSVGACNRPMPDRGIFSLGIPILGICYGMQITADMLGGKVSYAASREYGFSRLKVLRKADLFHGLPGRLQVWMSHGDTVLEAPAGFETQATTDSIPIAAFADPKRRIYGVQFHPEVVHTPRGTELFADFLFRIARCKPNWNMASFVEAKTREIREQVGKGKVLVALSGGVDSSVMATLIARAVGDQLVAVFVDNGVVRKGELIEVRDMFSSRFNLFCIDAGQRFLKKLRGVSDPERKRKIIGTEFIRVFEEEARRHGPIKYLAQGTLYPDLIESRSAFGGPSATIKSHHNVGGLPARMNMKLVEPLRELFKDEVRALGRELGLPENIVGRQPFPGPGLAVRILGAVSAKRVAILQEADAILLEEIRRAGLYDKIWQAFAVLLPVKTVGVMGDERTYEWVIAVRAVTSLDAMTADWADLPHKLLARISNRIINEVRGVNRVVYDISTKPPSTIEWE